MGYQVLARKWRPNQFSELVGQEHVVTAITHAINNDRLHHAYLFTGTRGVGKTTIARIFSKSLNCEEGQSAEPCGVCDTCVSIEQGNFVDLLEIDAASRTKVEDTRELLDNVQYKPTRGRYKVYLIDEVHMLSKHSFNALLKTLEEPPPHVKFLLATTDPQKLPVTILSRCLQFNLKALSREQISTQLAHILHQESIPAEDSALLLLARAAQGSMRDALSLTDQAIAQGDNQVQRDIVTDMLGIMDKQILLKLLNAVIEKKQDVLMDVVNALAEQSPDYAHVLSELSSLLHQIALTQWVPDACKLETTSARAIYTLAKSVSTEHVQLLYKLVLEGKKELPLSVDGRTCLEMTLLRMLSFAPKQVDLSRTQHTIVEAPVASSHADTTLAPAPAPAPAPEPEPEPQASSEESSNSAQLDTSTPAEHEPPFNESPAQNDADDYYGVSVSADEQNDWQAHQDMAEMERQQNELEQQRAESITPAAPANQPSEFEKTQALLALRQKLAAEKSASEQKEEPATKKPLTPERPKPIGEREAQKHVTPENTPPGSMSLQQDIPPPWVVETSTTENVNYLAEETALQQEAPTVNVQFDEVEQASIARDTEVSTPVVAEDQDIKPFLDNGEKLTHAMQINAWSQLIEQSRLGGLNKQIALNASFTKVESNVTLLVDNAQAHLVSQASIQELESALSDALEESITVEIKMGEPDNTPTNIQNQIRHMRQQHAQHVVDEDVTINTIISAFDAKIDPSSIKAR